MTPRPARAAALTLFVVIIAMVSYALASLLLPGTELIPNRPSVADFVLTSLTFIAFPSVGLLVVWKRPEHPMGWLFLVIGMGVTTSVFATEYVDRAVYAGADLPAVAIVAWLGGGTWFLSPALALTFGVLLFPTGRLPSRRWRPLAWLAAIIIPALFLAELVRPGPIPGYEHVPIERPLAVGAPIGPVLAAVGEIGLVVVFSLGIASITSLVLRFRRATGMERQQLKWFLYPMSLLLVGLVTASIVDTGTAWSLALLGLGLVPLGAGIGILRHRLFDIDLVINRTLVYLTLTVLLGSVYVGLVLGLQALVTPLLGTDTVAVALSTLAVAGLFGPARRRVQAGVDRRFYRSRYDAQRTVEVFAVRLRDQIDPDHLTDVLREATIAALKPRSASIWLRER